MKKGVCKQSERADVSRGMIAHCFRISRGPTHKGIGELWNENAEVVKGLEKRRESG